MAQLFYKGVLILKPRKKSLKMVRMMILISTMVLVCGVYLCLKRTHIEKKRELFEFQVIKRPHPNNLLYPNRKTLNRPQCGRIPVHLFVIVSMQRSGSGWFETLLNSHINISSNGEIFGQMNRRQNVSLIIETLDKVYNMELLTSSSKNECSSAIGFKWMLNQGLMDHPKEILDYFDKRGVSVIFFLRRNMLRRLVSILANSFDKDAKLLNGVHVSHVHSHQEALTLSRYKPTINITSLESDLEEMESTVTKAFDYFNSTRHIIVYYEDLIKNPSPKLTQVEEFLNMGQMKLSSQQVKIHKGALSEHINNWEEVNKTLTGTIYERFLRAEY